MSDKKFQKTDFREYKLYYDEGILSTYISLKLTQLEILKIWKALKKSNMIMLALKFEKLIKVVDNETGEKTDFSRTLPRKNNGRVIKSWENI